VRIAKPATLDFVMEFLPKSPPLLRFRALGTLNDGLLECTIQKPKRLFRPPLCGG
jgi:hypothetical protein